MILTLTRTDDEGEYDLELEVSYETGATVPPYLWGEALDEASDVLLQCAWDIHGKAVALTDDEIARLEQMIADKLEMM